MGHQTKNCHSERSEESAFLFSSPLLSSPLLSSPLFSASSASPLLFLCVKSFSSPAFSLLPYFLTSFHHPRQHCGFLLLQHPVSPPRNPFHRQRPQADALQFFQRVLFLEQHAPQLFFLRIPHPHFVPIILRASARRVRLAHRLHLHANLFAQPLQVRQRQHAFHLHLIDLLQLRPVLQHLRRQVAVIR